MCFVRHFLLFFCLLLTGLAFAQVADSTEVVPEFENDVIEDFLNNTGGDGFDFNTIFEDLEIAARNKIDLNKISLQQILDLGIIDELAANAIIQHRNKYGNFISLEELQAVDQLGMDELYELIPFISVKGGIDDVQVKIQDFFTKGSNDLYLRWSTLLEDQKGFIPLEPGQDAQRYLGSKDRIYARLKHSYEDFFSYGFTMEKDAGEEFFRGSNKQGFDFYSAHIFARRLSDRVRAVAIGDFNVQFGQGLILNSGFGRGKSADAVRIKRNGYTLRAYTSVAENDFMRGAGATLGLLKDLELTVFGSRLERDANVVLPDTLDQEEFFFSSLQTSGFHRTPNEIADENSITQNTLGGNLNWNNNNINIGANVLYNFFNKPFDRNIQAYNKFLFNDDRLLNASLDYSYIKGNVHFFGETAFSDNGGVATLNSILLSLDRKATLAISYRDYSKEYQALNANGFGETTTVNNEKGLYLGLEFAPHKQWRINAYADVWQHPWLRFNVDGASTGSEYLARVTYSQRRKMEFYTQFRLERKQRNNANIEAVFDQLVDQSRSQLRFHFKTILTSSIELRSRIEISSFTNSDGIDNSFGYLIYQDLIYRPRFSPFSLTTRVALFDTDDFSSRIYAYENDLLFNFSIPAYFNQGIRFYVNLRYKPNRSTTLEFRFAQSRFANLDVISSGLNEIQGNTRTELKAQIKYKF